MIINCNMWDQRKLIMGTPGNSALQKMKAIALLFMIIYHLPEKKKKKALVFYTLKNIKDVGDLMNNGKIFIIFHNTKFITVSPSEFR